MLLKLLLLAAAAVVQTPAAPQPPTDPLIPICAVNVMEKLQAQRTGRQPATLETYLSSHGMTDEQKVAARHTCEVFEAGVVFGIILSSPPTDEGADEASSAPTNPTV